MADDNRGQIMIPNNTKNATLITAVALISFGLTGCGGAKVLKAPIPVDRNEPVAVSGDGNLEAALDWVIVNNGPGSWAKKAAWDEYRFRVANTGDQPIELREIFVYDMLENRVRPNSDRRYLVHASKEVGKRYGDEGVHIEAGVGTATLMTAGAVSAAVGISAAAATPVLMSTATAGGVAGVAATGLLLAPVLATGGIVTAVNNSKIARQIDERSTAMPLLLDAGDSETVTAFYPVTPSPTRIEIVFMVGGEIDTIEIDTQASLAGLHIGEAANKEKRPWGQSRWAHPRQ